MDTRCTCAEARAKHAAEEIDRLKQQLKSKRRQFREQCDISDTWRIQKEEVRRLLDEERDSRLSLLVTISEGIAREDAMRELLCEAQATIKRLDDGLAQACVANDSLVSQLRERDRQIAELKERTIENAKQARGTDQPPWRRESARHGEVLPSC